jgi:hypothetical protein
MVVLSAVIVTAADCAEQRPGGPVATQLTAAAEIEGVPCAAGTVWYHANGRLCRCTLSRDATVRGAPLPAASSVAFNADGSHDDVYLPRTTEIQGLRCRGAGHQFMTTFHPDGHLKLCWLEADTVIQDVPCAAFSIWSDVIRRRVSGVSLHRNGRLAECRLARAVTLNGTRLDRDTRVRLDEDGRLVAAR